MFDQISIFDQNLSFLPKSRCLTKSQFSTKISMFAQNLDFWPKFGFLVKISIFDQNFDFWTKYRCLTKIFDFWPKFRLLTKISIFDPKTKCKISNVYLLRGHVNFWCFEADFVCVRHFWSFEFQLRNIIRVFAIIRRVSRVPMFFTRLLSFGYFLLFLLGS